MDIEQEREKKQKYLCKEILDKNYDQNEFENFCRESMMSANFGGEIHIDIDKLDFLELKLIVKNFQKQAKTLDEQREQNELSQQVAYDENYNIYQQQNEGQYEQFQEVDHIEEQLHDNQVDHIEEPQQDNQEYQQNENQYEQQQVQEEMTYNQSEDTQNNQHIEEQATEAHVNGQEEEHEEDLFEKFDVMQCQKQLVNQSDENCVRDRSSTDIAFEKFQQNLVSTPNNDFQSNIWQMPDFSDNKIQAQATQNNQTSSQGQDPFQYVGFDSFDKQNPQKEKNQDQVEQIKKNSISSKQNQQQVQQAANKTKEDSSVQSDQNAASTRNRSSASNTIDSGLANNQADVREKKSSSNASVDSSQLQEIEFQKQMEEFKANDFKTLKQLNLYSAGQQPEVIESNNVIKIQCKRLGQSLISTKKQVNVYISNVKQVQSGLFGSVTTYYVIQTKPFGWEVSRKLEDFQWLQAILTKMYPGVVIPKLIQAKKIKTEKQEKNRKTYLEHFLNLLVQNKDLKNSKFILDFLFITDEKIFKEKIKESDKFPKPKNIAYILNHDGFVRLDYSKLESKAVDEALNTYLDVNDGYYKRLKKLSKDLMSQLQVVSNTLFDIGSTFTNIYQNTIHFKQQVQNHNHIQVTQQIYVFALHKTQFLKYKFQFDQILDTYKIMNNINMMQANSIKDQIRSIENHYYHFFKFQKENNFSIKTLSKLKTQMQDEYVKKISNKSMLTSLKKTFSSNGNESIDIPSKEPEVLKDQIAFYTYQLDKQITSQFYDKSRSYANEFGMYANLSQCFQSEMKLFWQDVLKSLELVKQSCQGKKMGPLKIDMMKKIN
ncbi:hypothetical protein ABPG74_001570 [Tetrahymena malaccensis]